MPDGSWIPANTNVTPKLVGGSTGQRVTVRDHASCNHPLETQAVILDYPIAIGSLDWLSCQHGGPPSMLALKVESSSGKSPGIILIVAPGHSDQFGITSTVH